MKKVALIFPHQLFQKNPLFDVADEFYVIEEFLFFRQYAFHKQKLVLHRASMQFYCDYLKGLGKTANYVESSKPTSDISKLIPFLSDKGISDIAYIDPTDCWLEKRLKKAAHRKNLGLHELESRLFINSRKDNQDFFRQDKRKFFQTTFYKAQRQRLNVLIDDGDPVGGKWSYDIDNRIRYPKTLTPPAVAWPELTAYFTEARDYVQTNFPLNPGEVFDYPLYPITFSGSKKWFTDFLHNRFYAFGPYEDAMVSNEGILHHSVLTPMLNIGLISPNDIIDEALEFATNHDIPINSVEGFIRQIIGWREFIRGVYEASGSIERTTNFWNFDRKIPPSFYTGKTGIYPVDNVIKKVLKTGYCHHIERLMVLGNFMVLCEFDPDEVYRWFMELFIDSYDWVMVPNVYGMSQFADGGLMSTKPYISSSNYLMKMSDFPKGEWQKVWDGLFWRFMHVHRDFFSGNPRLSMLVRSLDRMSGDKLNGHVSCAEQFLSTLQ